MVAVLRLHHESAVTRCGAPPTGGAWDQAAGSTRFTDRGGHDSVVLDGALYVITGGAGNSGTTGRDHVWRSTDRGVTWTHVNASAASGDKFPARSRHSAAVLGDTVYVIAGSQGGASRGDVWKSDDKGAAWTQAAGNAEFSDRLEDSSAAQGGALYVIGDSSSEGRSATLFNDVWKSTDGGTSWVNVHKNP